jgi:drug/metabolite transporter (DMT)-like permease
MARMDRLDAFGATSLILFSALLGFNQVVIAVVNEGLQPIFFAGLRSLGAALVIYGWIRLRRLPARVSREAVWPGLALGLAFAV